MPDAKFSVTFELEPICKVVCMAMGCRNNLAHTDVGYFCKLKYIDIDQDGRCAMFDPLKPGPTEKADS